MSAPRPYWTDPFHPLGSIPNMEQFLYIYNNVPVISSMWYVQMFANDNCACALTETQIMIPSHLKSLMIIRCFGCLVDSLSNGQCVDI